MHNCWAKKWYPREWRGLKRENIVTQRIRSIECAKLLKWCWRLCKNWGCWVCIAYWKHPSCWRQCHGCTACKHYEGHWVFGHHWQHIMDVGELHHGHCKHRDHTKHCKQLRRGKRSLLLKITFVKILNILMLRTWKDGKVWENKAKWW